MKTKSYTEKATVELIWQVENSTINIRCNLIFKGQDIHYAICIDLIR